MNRNVHVPFLGEGQRKRWPLTRLKAIIPKGKYAGTHEGRIVIRFRPSFQLGKIDVHPKYLCVLQRSDGYTYEQGVGVLPLTA